MKKSDTTMFNVPPPNKDFSNLHTIALIITIIAGIWGTLINFIRKDTTQLSIIQKIISIALDAFINIGLTLIVFIGLSGYGFNDLISVSVASLIGHRGVQGFYLLELIIAEKLGAKQTFNHIKKDKGNKNDIDN